MGLQRERGGAVLTDGATAGKGWCCADRWGYSGKGVVLCCADRWGYSGKGVVLYCADRWGYSGKGVVLC